MVVRALLPLLAAAAVATTTAAPAAPALYPHPPGTVLDPRVVADIGGGGDQAAQLAVEDAPAVPQTRDPGHGRPPFTSSRLRLASSTSLRVTLRCLGGSGSTPCSFGEGAALRGVGFDGAIDSSVAGQLTFSLPAPPAGQLAVHCYLQASVHSAAGPAQFARGTLFYFWVDMPPAENSSPPPLRIDATTLGISANASNVQTAAIQHLLDTISLPQGGRLFFPGPALYRTAGLVFRRPFAVELGAGATLQHPAPAASPPLPPPPPHRAAPARGNCSEPAFITISAASGVYIGGRGGTVDANGFAGNAVCIADAQNIHMQSLLLRGSASWSTHIFRSSDVLVEGLKIFSGADGFDPDNSKCGPLARSLSFLLSFRTVLYGDSNATCMPPHAGMSTSARYLYTPMTMRSPSKRPCVATTLNV